MNRALRHAWLLLAIVLALGTGCRFQRNPALSPFSADAGALHAAPDAQTGGTSGTPAPTTGGMSASGAGGGATSESGAGGTSGASGSGGAGGTIDAAIDPIGPDATVTGGSGGSCDPDVQLCNPVTNDGCPPEMQCAVDAFSDVLAGYCIFNGPVAGGCFNSGVTESCPPTQTCFDFECRTLCFCDDDCMEGQCCVEPVGTLGFKVCGEC